MGRDIAWVLRSAPSPLWATLCVCVCECSTHRHMYVWNVCMYVLDVHVTICSIHVDMHVCMYVLFVRVVYICAYVCIVLYICAYVCIVLYIWNVCMHVCMC